MKNDSQCFSSRDSKGLRSIGDINLNLDLPTSSLTLPPLCLYSAHMWSGRMSPGGNGDANRLTRQNPSTSFTHLEMEWTHRRGQRQDSKKQEKGKTGRSRGSWGTKIHIQTIWNEALTARTRRTGPGLSEGEDGEEKWEEEESHTAWTLTDKTEG